MGNGEMLYIFIEVDLWLILFLRVKLVREWAVFQFPGFIYNNERMKHYLPTLRGIHGIGEKAKRDYVKKCDSQIIDCVSECAKMF